ncbi:hypothetical protein BH11PLA2_BH11PLA2_34340 [soil metagenome]
MIVEVQGFIGSMKLMPPREGHCRICAVKHEPDSAHDATSLFFQMRFKMRHKRDGTWADAVAHLPPELRMAWRRCLEEFGGVWTEPPAGVEPIAEPIDG